MTYLSSKWLMVDGGVGAAPQLFFFGLWSWVLGGWVLDLSCSEVRVHCRQCWYFSMGWVDFSYFWASFNNLELVHFRCIHSNKRTTLKGTSCSSCVLTPATASPMPLFCHLFHIITSTATGNGAKGEGCISLYSSLLPKGPFSFEGHSTFHHDHQYHQLFSKNSPTNMFIFRKNVQYFKHFCSSYV